MDMKQFEVPADMRKFAEQSVEQARQAFDRFVSAAHEAIADFEDRAQAARSGAMDVGGRAMSFAERNMAASFDFAQKLVKARDVEEVVRLQTEYVKTQVQVLIRVLCEDLPLQAAIDAPRFKICFGGDVALEPGHPLSGSMAPALQKDPGPEGFGSAQVVGWRHGVLDAGADARRGGFARLLP